MIDNLSGSLLLLGPALLVFGMALIVMLLEAIQRPESKRLFWGLSLAALVGAGLWTAAQAGDIYDGVSAFAGMVRFDGYGLFFQAAAILSGILALLMSDSYLERIGVRVGEYYAVALFGVCGMMLMGFANDLMMVFISLEVMSISMYVLSALKRSDPRSVESGFKYFILGAFSSGLMLYGIACMYGAAGSTSLAALAELVKGHPSEQQSALLALGGALLVAGFGFKVASVPFHMWTPDVYQGAPTSVAALMSGGVKAASFAAFGRIALVVLGEAGGPFGTAVWWMAAATMVVGNVGALVQNDLKRMLAYSSIAHAGYLLMALAGIGAGGGVANENVGSLLFYAVAYTIMNAGTWAALSMFVSDGRDNTDISALAGLGRSQPVLAAMISLCLLSLAGIPPTIGFIGKFYLFSAAVEAGLVSLAIVGAISAAFGVYYYLRPMVYMYMRDGHPEVEDRFGWAAVTIGLCAAAILLIGVMPGPLLDWANASVRSVVG